LTYAEKGMAEIYFNNCRLNDSGIAAE